MLSRPWGGAVRLVVLTASAAACTSSNGVTAPTPTLLLTVAAPVPARLVDCTPCEEPSLRMVAEFPVTVADPLGPGGSVERVEVVVRNVSRNVEVGRNVRPNRDFAYADTHLPRGGSLTLDAGIVFSLPPPRDQIELTVTVALTDGRSQRRTVGIQMVL